MFNTPKIFPRDPDRNFLSGQYGPRNFEYYQINYRLIRRHLFTQNFATCCNFYIKIVNKIGLSRPVFFFKSEKMPCPENIFI